MFKSTMNIQVLLFLMVSALLSACSTWPDIPVIAAEGEANNAPIIIFGTRWVFSDQSDATSKIGFINLQKKDIASIRLYVAQCGSKGAKLDAGHALLNGPFPARQSFIADASWAESPGSYSYSPGFSIGLIITKIEITEADGTKIEYVGKDVSTLMEKNLVNYCSNFASYYG